MVKWRPPQRNKHTEGNGKTGELIKWRSITLPLLLHRTAMYSHDRTLNMQPRNQQWQTSQCNWRNKQKVHSTNITKLKWAMIFPLSDVGWCYLSQHTHRHHLSDKQSPIAPAPTWKGPHFSNPNTSQCSEVNNTLKLNLNNIHFVSINVWGTQ
jgi:hypothetical protein